MKQTIPIIAIFTIYLSLLKCFALWISWALPPSCQYYILSLLNFLKHKRKLTESNKVIKFILYRNNISNITKYLRSSLNHQISEIRVAFKNINDVELLFFYLSIYSSIYCTTSLHTLKNFLLLQYFSFSYKRTFENIQIFISVHLKFTLIKWKS